LLKVAAGQRVVVMGATGGVGGYAVQMARALGAHVLATVRGDADEARRLGAEEVYDTKAVDVIDALHAAHSDGVDAILDLVNGKDAIRRDAEILKPGGGVVSTIGAADETWFAGRQVKAYNINAELNPAESSQGLDQVARMLAEGKITARISTTVDLDGAAAACGAKPSSGSRGDVWISPGLASERCQPEGRNIVAQDVSPGLAAERCQPGGRNNRSPGRQSWVTGIRCGESDSGVMSGLNRGLAAERCQPEGRNNRNRGR
jgi:NAD(P)-dependent dehydrogenase (short-subunit alcohol dehydrogenase family)